MYRVLISTSKTPDLFCHKFVHSRLAPYPQPFDIEDVRMGLPVGVPLAIGSRSV
jgi:hypothetical protein